MLISVAKTKLRNHLKYYKTVFYLLSAVSVLIILIFGLTLKAAKADGDFYTPLEIQSGFNSDCVMEDDNEAGQNSFAESIDGTFSFLSIQGVDRSLPFNRLIKAQDSHYYDLEDYADNNTLMLRTKSGTADGRIVFASESQKKFSGLGFLVTGANGGGSAKVTVNTDKTGQSSFETSISIPDWANLDDAVYLCSECRVSTGGVVLYESRGLYERVIDVPEEYRNSNILSVDLSFTDPAWPSDPLPTVCIFAISGKNMQDTYTAVFDTQVTGMKPRAINSAAGSAITLPDYEYDGQIIEGWYDGDTDNSANRVGGPGNSYTLTKNVVLTGKLMETNDPYVILKYNNPGSHQQKVYLNAQGKLPAEKYPAVGELLNDYWVVTGYYKDADLTQPIDLTKAIPENLYKQTIYGTVVKYKYDIYVQGIQVTEFNKGNVLGDKKVSYNTETATLTLNNATIAVKEKDSRSAAGIVINTGYDEMNILLKGNNKIYLPEGEYQEKDFIYGISADRDNLSFSGSGSLEIDIDSPQDSYGIRSFSDISFKGCDIDISLTTGENSAEYSNGIHASSVIIEDNSYVSITVPDVNENNGGALNTHGIMLSNGSELHADGANSYGWKTDDTDTFDLDIQENCIAEFSGGMLAISCALNNNEDLYDLGALVNTAPSKTKAAAWNKSDPLGGTDSNYKYVKIPENAQEIKLNKSNISIMPGSSEVLKASVAGSNDNQFEWTSSNTKIATVDKNGKVTGVKQGKAVITVKLKGTVKRAKCNVRVLFKDVKADHNFAKAVYWAADNGITGGYTGAKEGYFGINDPVERGQVVMFLWRLAGKPNPKSNKQTFKDVPTSHSYYKAIQWAFENGIAAGYGNKKFGVKDDCTRGQIAMFIWRYKGNEAPSGNKQTFKDVPTSHNFYKAIQWGYEKGIIGGYTKDNKKYFAPGDKCTRGQMVTFLWRMEGKP